MAAIDEGGHTSIEGVVAVVLSADSSGLVLCAAEAEKLELSHIEYHELVEVVLVEIPYIVAVLQAQLEAYPFGGLPQPCGSPETSLASAERAGFADQSSRALEISLVLGERIGRVVRNGCCCYRQTSRIVKETQSSRALHILSDRHAHKTMDQLCGIV